MGTRLRGPLAALLSLVLVAGLAAPAAGQLDARSEPAVTGPLTAFGDGKRCRATKYEVEGEIVARAKICLFLYALDPDQEDDEEDDYGVMWAQTNVDTSGGWCAFRVHTEVYIPSAMPMYASVPKAQKITKRKTVRWKLTVDAANQAAEAATVKKGLTLYPDSLRRSRRASDDEGVDIVRLTWRGETARKLGFVSGFEVSWKEDDGPPDAVPFRVEYPIREC
ncbi:MAG TPA: hypothetical protein VEV43_05230 [Actinomycetota bacterium]|nr:hypothetical protein [Actinomycetota bacterium]